jgi:hypothetical protein
VGTANATLPEFAAIATEGQVSTGDSLAQGSTGESLAQESTAGLVMASGLGVASTAGLGMASTAAAVLAVRATEQFADRANAAVATARLLAEVRRESAPTADPEEVERPAVEMVAPQSATTVAPTAASRG